MGLEMFLARKANHFEFTIQGNSTVFANHSLSLRVPTENRKGTGEVKVIQALYDGEEQKLTQDQMRAWCLSLLREAKRFKQ
jgi:hypothetical protein